MAEDIPLQSDSNAAPAGSPPQPGAAPSTPSGSAPAKPPTGPRINAPSVLQLAEAEPCPKCGAPMAHDQVLCVKCGYDYRAGSTRATATGVVEVPIEAKEQLEDFVTVGRGSAQTIAIIGGGVLVAALVAAGYFAPPGSTAMTIFGLVGFALFQAFLHTGTGVLAIAGAAWATQMRLGRVDLAVARIFLAFSLFLLVINCNIPLAPDTNHVLVGVVGVSKWILGMGVYWLAVMALFRKPPQVAGFVGGLHFCLFVIVKLGMFLEAWLSTVSTVAAPVKAAAAAAGTGG